VVGLFILIDLTLPDSDTKVHMKTSHIENFGVNVHSAFDWSHTIRPGDYRLVQYSRAGRDLRAVFVQTKKANSRQEADF
jgi:hypothetical protein